MDVILKKPPTYSEKLIDKQLKILKKNNILLTEEVKVLERRLDFMQDESAKIIIEQQALIKSMRAFTKIANDLLTADEQAAPNPPAKKPDNTGIH